MGALGDNAQKLEKMKWEALFIGPVQVTHFSEFGPGYQAPETFKHRFCAHGLPATSARIHPGATRVPNREQRLSASQALLRGPGGAAGWVAPANGGAPRGTTCQVCATLPDTPAGRCLSRLHPCTYGRRPRALAGPRVREPAYPGPPCGWPRSMHPATRLRGPRCVSPPLGGCHVSLARSTALALIICGPRCVRRPICGRHVSPLPVHGSPVHQNAPKTFGCPFLGVQTQKNTSK